jgi:pSer/pThr/pTyr-binding forkhead associated (FHA) protein
VILHARLVAPDGSPVGEFVVSKFPARVGRDPAAEIAVDDQQFPVVSGLHAEIDCTPAGLLLTPRSPKNLTLHNGQPVKGPVELRAGDCIRLGVTGPTVKVIRIEAGERPAARRGTCLGGILLPLMAVALALVLFGVVGG